MDKGKRGHQGEMDGKRKKKIKNMQSEWGNSVWREERARKGYPERVTVKEGRLSCPRSQDIRGPNCRPKRGVP